MQEILLKMRYFERGLLKVFKKLPLFILLNPVPFNGQNYPKQKGSGTSYQVLFKLRSKFRNVLCYVLSDQV